MFGNKALEKALAVVLAENSDLKSRVRELEAEQSSLINRIMALTNVPALREATRRSPIRDPEDPQEAGSSETDKKGHRFPGNQLMVPPTRPPTPPDPFAGTKRLKVEEAS